MNTAGGRSASAHQHCSFANPFSLPLALSLSRPQVVNDCGSLRAAFDCASCGDSIGGDQPAFVDRGADVPQSAAPGACLVNGDATLFSCDARYEWTRRLCPCDTGAAGEEALQQ